MNFSIAKDAFARVLYISNSIVERRNTMPILANVRITAEKDSIAIAATDLEVSLLGVAQAKVKTPGSITVDAKVLYEIVRELPDNEIVVQVGKANRLEIESGQSRFKINGTSAEEFPAIVGTAMKNPIAVDATKIYEMLEKTAFSVSTDETRYNINGVFVQTIDGGKGGLLRFVATDGHRLAMIERPAEGLSLPSSVIVPRKGIQELKKVLEGNDGVAEVGTSEGFFTVKSGDITLGIRLVDGQFPDYQQVIPKTSSTEVTVSTQELLSAVKRVSLVTTDKNKAIRVKLIGGNLLISSQSPEYGEASENLSVDQQGEDVTIGFSAKYLVDILNAMSKEDSVKIKFSGELGPGLFTSPDNDSYTCVVMPMRFE